MCRHFYVVEMELDVGYGLKIAVSTIRKSSWVVGCIFGVIRRRR